MKKVTDSLAVVALILLTMVVMIGAVVVSLSEGGIVCPLFTLSGLIFVAVFVRCLSA